MQSKPERGHPIFFVCKMPVVSARKDITKGGPAPDGNTGSMRHIAILTSPAPNLMACRSQITVRTMDRAGRRMAYLALSSVISRIWKDTILPASKRCLPIHDPIVMGASVSTMRTGS